MVAGAGIALPKVFGRMTGSHASQTQKTISRKNKDYLFFLFVAGAGIEPATLALWVLRSNQLSYPALLRTWKDSNLQPLGPKPSALSIELQVQI